MTEYNLDLLECVDTMIKDNETQQSDLLWEDLSLIHI